MTSFQMIAIAILAAVVVVQFVLPHLKMPARRPNTMKQIESVIAIKESATNPKVVEACTQLLQALLN